MAEFNENTDFSSSIMGSLHGLLVTFPFAANTSDTFLSLCGLLAWVIIFHCLFSLTFLSL